MKQKPIAIFLMGPTASGKTALSFELVKVLPVEIISVDSAMVYRGMDIGTGKPSKEDLAKIPHHLIDIKNPDEPYSAAEFAKDALQIMHDIIARGRYPLLVGGTLLYFKALQQGLSKLPSSDPNIRQSLSEQTKQMGLAKMYERLKMLDKKAADKIHPNDPQRILRALEVYEITKKPMSELQTCSQRLLTAKESFPFEVKAFALVPEDRRLLHKRIEHRFHDMLNAGLVQEVKALYEKYHFTPNLSNVSDVSNLSGLPDLPDLSHLPTLPAMRAVGYRQIICYLTEQYDYNEMVLRGISSTRQLAKRQLTWLRSLTNIHYLNFTENNHLDLLQTMINCVFSEQG